MHTPHIPHIIHDPLLMDLLNRMDCPALIRDEPDGQAAKALPRITNDILSAIKDMNINHCHNNDKRGDRTLKETEI